MTKITFFGSGPWAETTRQQIAQQSNYQLVDTGADIGIVVHYGKILSIQELQAFPRGVLNIHPSLLPAWRGPAPLQAAILNGDANVGVSVMMLDQHMDTGPILAQQTVPLPPTAIAHQFYPELFQLGTKLLLASLPRYIQGTLSPVPQITTGVSYSHIIKRIDGQITRNDSAIMIDRKFRAYHPWPGIYCIWRGQRIKFTAVALTATGQLDIQMVQPSGKKPMPYTAFLRGYSQFSLADL